MNQLNTNIPMMGDYGQSAMQQMTGALNLSNMMQQRKNEELQRQEQLLKSQELKRQNELITKGAAENKSPVDLVAMGVDPAILEKYSTYYDNNREWLLKDKEQKNKFQQENNRQLASIAYEIDPNDPNAVQIFNERAHILGLSTEGMPNNIESIKALTSTAMTPAQRKEFEQKGLQLQTEKYAAETNRKNAETQAGNLELQKKEFEFKKTQKKEEKPLEGIDPDTGKPYTQGQRTAANYAIRIQEAENNLDRLSKLGFNPADIRSIILNPKKMDAVKSPELRQYAQAMRTFINAVLRRESGAAISPSEFDSANAQYFASLNDDPTTLTQKRNTRLQVLGALKAEAGTAFQDAMNEYNKLSGNNQAPQPQQQIPKIKNDADYDKLKSGDFFIDPYGNKRRKP